MSAALPIREEDTTADRFLDLVLGDPDLLDAEFGELVSGLGEPPDVLEATAPAPGSGRPPLPPSTPRKPNAPVPAGVVGGTAGAAVSRSPPHHSAGPAGRRECSGPRDNARQGPDAS